MSTPSSETITPAQQNEVAMRVLAQFRQVFSAVRTNFHKLEEQAGVSGAQLWALSVIRDQAGLGINDLSARLNVRQPTASNLVKTLSKRGMVEVRRSAMDKRSVHLSVTAAGLSAINRAPGPVNGVLPHALAELPPQVLAQLEQHLSLLVIKMRADAQAARVPLSELVNSTVRW